MATVVSATTRSISKYYGKQAGFISRASVLIRDALEAYQAGDYASALEFAYQAALRTAGACVAGSAVANRRRRPSSAWAQLELVDSRGGEWAAIFKPYSRMRSRAINGLETEVEPQMVAGLLELVEQFLDEVEGGVFAGAIAA
ncbi:SAV_6107 family HEPN domain-containing protein [Corynebacterium sp. H128]|uniref:SAV_6107 family HEPN domain-containing protein n=1 Tax=unclassified Corynebacterium TaxID=2624378 RepID=UPI0030B68042